MRFPGLVLLALLASCAHANAHAHARARGLPRPGPQLHARAHARRRLTALSLDDLTYDPVVVESIDLSQGSPGCPCLPPERAVGFVAEPGEDCVWTSEDDCLPVVYGASQCIEHDALYTQECIDALPLGVAPEWCTSAWCYVDGDNCDHDPRPSVFYDGLHYSYTTCGNLDSYDPGKLFVRQLQERPLRVTVPGATPPFSYRFEGENTFTGPMPEFFFRMVQDLNIPWHYVHMNQHNVDNERWAGQMHTACVHQIALNETDICITNMWTTPERHTMAGFTPQITTEVFKLLVFRSEEVEKESMLALLAKPFSPFSQELWGLIAGGLTIFAVAIWWVDGCIFPDVTSKHVSEKERLRHTITDALKRIQSFAGAGHLDALPPTLEQAGSGPMPQASIKEREVLPMPPDPSLFERPDRDADRRQFMNARQKTRAFGATGGAGTIPMMNRDPPLGGPFAASGRGLLKVPSLKRQMSTLSNKTRDDLRSLKTGLGISRNIAVNMEIKKELNEAAAEGEPEAEMTLPLMHSMLYSLVSLVSASPAHPMTSLSGIVISIIWGAFTLITVALYTASSASQLVNQSNVSATVTTIDDAVRLGFRVCVPGGMFDLAADSIPGLRTVAISDPSWWLPDLLQEMDAGRCEAAIVSDAMMELVARGFFTPDGDPGHHCDKAWVGDVLLTVPDAWPVAKELQQAMSWMVLKYRSAGWYDQTNSPVDGIAPVVCGASTSATNTGLAADALVGMFWVACLVTAITLGWVLFTRLLRRGRRARKLKRCKQFNKKKYSSNSKKKKAREKILQKISSITSFNKDRQQAEPLRNMSSKITDSSGLNSIGMNPSYTHNFLEQSPFGNMWEGTWEEDSQGEMDITANTIPEANEGRRTTSERHGPQDVDDRSSRTHRSGVKFVIPPVGSSRGRRERRRRATAATSCSRTTSADADASHATATVSAHGRRTSFAGIPGLGWSQGGTRTTPSSMGGATHAADMSSLGAASHRSALVGGDQRRRSSGAHSAIYRKSGGAPGSMLAINKFGKLDGLKLSHAKGKRMSIDGDDRLIERKPRPTL